MELAALLISIVSLLGSGLFALLGLLQNIKIHKATLEEEYFKEIYKNHLIHKIPDARHAMHFDINGQLCDATELINELSEIRRDSLYFQYNNRPFYDNLKSRLQRLEDYIIMTEEHILHGEEITDFFNQVQEMLSDIYSVIASEYTG